MESFNRRQLPAGHTKVAQGAPLDKGTSDQEMNLVTQKNNIGDCGKESCRYCHSIAFSVNVKCRFTGQSFSTTNVDDQTNKCEVENCVYMITCKKTGLQYVGETGRQMKKRLCEHFGSIKHKKGGCGILMKHFDSEDDLNVTILEKIHRLPNETTAEMNKRRRLCEKKWIQRMWCIFPYGLNAVESQGENALNSNEKFVGGKFPRPFSIPWNRD